MGMESEKTFRRMRGFFLKDGALTLAAFVLGAVFAWVLSYHFGGMSWLNLLAGGALSAGIWLLARIVSGLTGRFRGRRWAALVWLVAVLGPGLLAWPKPQPSMNVLPPYPDGAEEKSRNGFATRVRYNRGLVSESRLAQPLVPGRIDSFMVKVPEGAGLSFGVLTEGPARCGLTLSVFAPSVESLDSALSEQELWDGAAGWRDVTLGPDRAAGRVRLDLMLAKRERASGNIEDCRAWVSEPMTNGPGAEPDVILLVLDTARADHVSFDESNPGLTPNLARWSRGGVVFEKHYAQSSWTLPSTASLLTSKMPIQTGVVTPEQIWLGHEQTTLAEALRARGYYTAAVSANLLVGPSRNFDQGFERFVTVRSKLRYGLDNASRANRAALRVLGEKPARPFFLYLHYIDPHLPYLPPGEFRPSPFEAGPLFSARALVENLTAPLFGAYQRPATDLADANRGLYRGEVSYLDAAVGKLFEELDSRGLLKNAVVVVTSDHGEEWRDHGLTGHGTSLFEELVRAPFAIVDFRNPRAETRRVGETTSNLDVTPTIIELSGAAAPDGMLGRSLLAETAPTEDPAPVFMELPRIVHFDEVAAKHRPGLEHAYLRAVVAGDKKVIAYSMMDTGGARLEAYDLAADPDESNDLAGESPEWMTRMVLAMDEFFAPMPRPADMPEGGIEDPETRKLLRSLGYLK